MFSTMTACERQPLRYDVISNQICVLLLVSSCVFAGFLALRQLHPHFLSEMNLIVGRRHVVIYTGVQQFLSDRRYSRGQEKTAINKSQSASVLFISIRALLITFVGLFISVRGLLITFMGLLLVSSLLLQVYLFLLKLSKLLLQVSLFLLEVSLSNAKI